MKILGAQQIYQADKATILEQQISSAVLMERAAFQCFEFIINHYEVKNKAFKIFCGIGNNGGDGLVIGRYLKEINAEIQIYVVHFSEKQSEDFKVNLEKLRTLNVEIHDIFDEKDIPEINSTDFVIDAIFGVGLKKSPYGFTKKTIQKINKSGAYVLSIDVPSGLFLESSVSEREAVVKSNKVLTFQSPKLALLLPENSAFCPDFEIIDIGLSSNFINTLDGSHFYTTQKNVKEKYKPRTKFSHKGTYGHSVLIGGSFGKMGAICLASKAALKVGSGLVSVYIPKCGYQILQTAVPEVMVEVDCETEIQHFNFKISPNAIGVGPGLGLHEKTIDGFLTFLSKQSKPLVIDADALNIIAQETTSMDLVPKNSILTPHPKEFERLVGWWRNDFEKMEKLSKFSKKYQVIVVLKGAHTVIAFQDNLFFNATGNASLATAGSGDVLTGIITGLVAQGYNPLDAAVIGVYLHGLTADIYIQHQPQETLLASDIIDLLPQAILETFYK